MVPLPRSRRTVPEPLLTGGRDTQGRLAPTSITAGRTPPPPDMARRASFLARIDSSTSVVLPSCPFLSESFPSEIATLESPSPPAQLTPNLSPPPPQPSKPISPHYSGLAKQTRPAMSPSIIFPTADALKPAVLGTLLYFGEFTAFMAFQSFSKFYLLQQKRAEAKGKRVAFAAVKYYNGEDHLALTGDRTFGNMCEQALVFLPLFWLHAVFVDPSTSLNIAGTYVAFRSLYPVGFFLKSPLLFVSTVGGYGCLAYMSFGLFKACS